MYREPSDGAIRWTYFILVGVGDDEQTIHGQEIVGNEEAAHAYMRAAMKRAVEGMGLPPGDWIDNKTRKPVLGENVN